MEVGELDLLLSYCCCRRNLRGGEYCSSAPSIGHAAQQFVRHIFKGFIENQRHAASRKSCLYCYLFKEVVVKYGDDDLTVPDSTVQKTVLVTKNLIYVDQTVT